MKTIYFVRHGQTEGNAGKIFQGSDTPLNDVGREQARVVAERCTTLPITHIVGSSMARAKETAEIIGARVGKEVEASDLFTEGRRPSALMYRPVDDHEAREMQAAWVRGYLGDGPKVEDGEDVHDLVARAGRALEFLEQHPAEQLLVVTHGMFLRMLFARVIHGPDISNAEVKKTILSLINDNTGITVMVHTAGIEHEEKRWKVKVWNDQSHLG